jgi:hypothetical protein
MARSRKKLRDVAQRMVGRLRAEAAVAYPVPRAGGNDHCEARRCELPVFAVWVLKPEEVALLPVAAVLLVDSLCLRR